MGLTSLLTERAKEKIVQMKTASPTYLTDVANLVILLREHLMEHALKVMSATKLVMENEVYDLKSSVFAHVKTLRV